MNRIGEITIDSGFGLAEAFSVDKGSVVSLVGAGGKTTTLYALSLDLRRRGSSVITTSTTHMQMPMTGTTAPPLVIIDEEDNWLTTVKQHVARYGSVTVVQERRRDDKLRGMDPIAMDPLRSLADCLLIEADGARGRSLKAPAEHEPVIPEETNLSVVIVGMDALGLRLEEQNVHRLAIVNQLTWTTPGGIVTEDVIADTLANGYLPKLPEGVRSLAFLNKVDDSRLKAAETVGGELLRRGFSEVVFGEALRPHELFFRMRRPRGGPPAEGES